MEKISHEFENHLLNRFGSTVNSEKLPLVFILGSPRTGSTLVYQFLINTFDFFYISNFIDKIYANCPLIGAALDVQLNPRDALPYVSSYGKTESWFEPSEGSLVFRNWFGGGHPSEIKSAKVIPDRQDHMKQSLSAIAGLSNRPLLFKNAWHCFRIPELVRIFSECAFVWIRRDIQASAISDLEARYRRGSAESWNSASPANYHDLLKLPYWEQVVEQQYEYNRTIRLRLSELCPSRFIEIWYEDLCSTPFQAENRFVQFFSPTGVMAARRDTDIPNLNRSGGAKIPDQDRENICGYLKANYERFNEYTYDSTSA